MFLDVSKTILFDRYKLCGESVTFLLLIPAVFGQPFDEIIVESSLTVHRKNPRQERNNDLSKTVNGSNRNKRDVDVNTGELDIIEW